jgi:hypothetical protein
MVGKTRTQLCVLCRDKTDSTPLFTRVLYTSVYFLDKIGYTVYYLPKVAEVVVLSLCFSVIILVIIRRLPLFTSLLKLVVFYYLSTVANFLVQPQLFYQGAKNVVHYILAE